MLSLEFSKDVTLAILYGLNEDLGLTVDINDGEITGVNMEG